MTQNTNSVIAFKALVDKWSLEASKKFEVADTYLYTWKALEKIGDFKFCTKCGGTGFLREYSYIQSGVCFKCNGSCQTKFGLSVSAVASVVEQKPETLFKVMASKFRSEERARKKQEEKQQKFLEALAVTQEECLQLLPEQERREFLAIMENCDVVCRRVFAAEQPNLDDEEYLKLSVFTKDLNSRWCLHGKLSEKQMMALINSARKDAAKAELFKSARSFIPDEKYEDVVATVTKMDRIEVYPTPWAVAYTTKVVLIGANQEVIVVKTDNDKLLTVFAKSLADKISVTLSGRCKWTAPQGFPAVFTSRGMRVKI